MNGLLKISLPNYQRLFNIVTKTSKRTLTVGLIVLVSGLLYGSYILGTHTTFNNQKELAIAQATKPTPTAIPTNTPTPTIIPTITPAPTVVTPSNEALKVAAFFWMINNKAGQAQIRNLYGGTTDTETINDTALYLDQHPARLALDENKMQIIEQSASSPVYVQSPQSQMPVHCTTSYIGDFANTNCF